MLEVSNLQTIFTTEDGVVQAVNGISYSLQRGEALGIVGESGCGKSVGALSLMRLIPEPPGKIVAGEVLFQGRDVLRMDIKDLRSLRGNQIAMIFQDPLTSLNPVLTIGRQIVETVLLHTDRNREQARQHAIDLLDMVGIPDAGNRLNNYPHQFSGGMRQRVMIAMALSCDPLLLIADEPTTALDVTTQAQIIDLVMRLRKELGMAVIWITHDLGVVAGCVDKVIVMYAGQIVESAPVREFYANPSHPYSRGLLGSLPKLDSTTRERLTSIQGLPPNLIDMPDRCPFLDRCGHRIPDCRTRNPLLRSIAADHEIACWVNVND